jgi:hypothetical protein
MIEALILSITLTIGIIAGMFVACCRRRIDGVDGHVKIGDTWHEIDGHGRVVYRAEEPK